MSVNRAGGRAVNVSGLFLEAIGTALRVAAQTAGAVDPTVGRACGYSATTATSLRSRTSEVQPGRLRAAADWRGRSARPRSGHRPRARRGRARPRRDGEGALRRPCSQCDQPHAPHRLSRQPRRRHRDRRRAARRRLACAGDRRSRGAGRRRRTDGEPRWWGARHVQHDGPALADRTGAGFTTSSTR